MIAAFLLALSSSVYASPIADFQQQHGSDILRSLSELVAIPNTEDHPDGLKKNAEYVKTLLEQRGLKARLLQPKDPTAPAAVYGEWLVPGATRTLMFYAHYDGVTVSPEKWTVTQPFEPKLFSGRVDQGGREIPFPKPGEAIDPEVRLYGRSASDAKAGLMAIVSSVEAVRAQGLVPSSNIKIFIDGEEEVGSPHLGEIIDENKDVLKADAWIIHDSPLHPSGKKMIIFGVRGAIVMDITVYGPKKPLHSGHYGNWAPNPGMRLARLLASMKDDSGKILIRNFYKDVAPVGQAERKAVAELATYDAALMKQLGFAKPEGGGKALNELLLQPSLNVRGMESSKAGDAATMIIPATAQASIDLRLVKGNDKLRQVQKVIEHIKRQGYAVFDRDPTDEERSKHPFIAKVTHSSGNNADRVPMNLPIAKGVADAIQSTTQDPIIRLPTMGGSLPLQVVTEKLGCPSLVVPVANPDNNQHAENENLRIGNLWSGMDSSAAIMLMK